LYAYSLPSSLDVKLKEKRRIGDMSTWVYSKPKRLIYMDVSSFSDEELIK
jgi:hypothetical protein